MKIPRKASLKKMRGYPSFKMSFFQKSDVIWSLGHYPCSVLGLVSLNQEKHFWALLILQHKNSIKLGNILLQLCVWRNLRIFLIPNFPTTELKIIIVREQLFSKLT